MDSIDDLEHLAVCHSHPLEQLVELVIGSAVRHTDSIHDFGNLVGIHNCTLGRDRSCSRETYLPVIPMERTAIAVQILLLATEESVGLPAAAATTTDSSVASKVVRG